MAPVLKDNSDWLVKFAQGVMLAADILATYPLATKIMEIGAAAEGLAARLALNPWALAHHGVVASGAIIYKTSSDTRANLERGYEDMRRKALQKDKLVSMARRWVSVGLVFLVGDGIVAGQDDADL